MKKYILTMMLGLMIPFLAFTQVTDTASLNLVGVVGEFVSISVTPEPAANSLTLSLAQNSLLQVGTVTETSNTPYEVTVDSTNGFEFSDGNANLPYTFYYDGNPVTNSGDTVTTAAAGANVSKPVYVTYPSYSNEVPGSYSDTLTFTITSN